MGIKARCLNPKCPAYHRYGGRGITICDEWLTSFDAFLGDVGLRPRGDLTLDRIDTNDGYRPGNVRWADRKTQRTNQERTMLLPHPTHGPVTLMEWTRIEGVNYRAVYYRVHEIGESVDEAVRHFKSKSGLKREASV